MIQIGFDMVVKTIRKTYTIPEDIAELLGRESEKRDMHSSTLLAQLLRKSLTFDLPLKEIGVVTVPEPCFQHIVDDMDADKLQQVAEELSMKNFGLILALLGGRYDLESIIQSYYNKFGKYSGWYSFSYNVIDSKEQVYRLTLKHTRGIKWSRYLANYNHTILERVCGKVNCRIDDKVVEFEVMPRQATTIGK